MSLLRLLLQLAVLVTCLLTVSRAAAGDQLTEEEPSQLAALEDLANVRTARTQDDQPTTSQSQPRQKRRNDKVKQQIIYKTIRDVPRRSGYESLFPPLNGATVARQITTPYAPRPRPRRSPDSEANRRPYGAAFLPHSRQQKQQQQQQQQQHGYRVRGQLAKATTTTPVPVKSMLVTPVYYELLHPQAPGGYGQGVKAPPLVPSPRSPKPTQQPIWRDELNQIRGTNLKQSTGYEVPPVIVDNPRDALIDNPKPTGLKTGYFPPTQRVMPRVNHMQAECSDDVMKLNVKFNGSFDGLIYSAGYAYDKDCIYINGTGANEYEFFIQLNRCGTLGGSDHKKRDTGFKNTEPTKNFMWNTVTIQYSALIEEEWDEHFKVTCEYGYDFWKTVTFPFLDVEVNTADPVHFTLTPPECHMEIRNGYGPSGQRITAPVHVGDPLTLMVNMRSQWDGFDIVVNDCYAHNGANKRIQLIDHHGCPVDEKLISQFQGTWGMDGSMYQTVVYAHMKTFRFTGTPALYIECDIRMCHGRCPTQSCNWRSSDIRRRRRRETEDEDDTGADLAVRNETNLSENVRMFQSLHVLQSRDPDAAEAEDPLTASSAGAKAVSVSRQYTEDDDTLCLSSVTFVSIVGTLSLFSLMCFVTLTLLCLRLRRIKNTEDNHDMDALRTQTLRRGPLKSEYVHSSQQRIP